MKIFSVYKATNKIDGKSYIGMTGRNWTHRRNQHLLKAFDLTSNGYNTYFHRAIRKYGTDAFEWDLLYQTKDHDHCLNIEIHLIEEHKTHWKHNGYNMTLGGDKGGYNGQPISEDTRKKMSLSKMSKKPEERKKMARKWKVIDPSGKELIIENLFEFCKKNNLSQPNMSAIARGHKGWYCQKLN